MPTRTNAEINNDWLAVEADNVISMLDDSCQPHELATDEGNRQVSDDFINQLLWLQHLVEATNSPPLPCQIEAQTDLHISGWHYEDDEIGGPEPGAMAWVQQSLELHCDGDSGRVLSFHYEPEGPRRLRVESGGRSLCLGIDLQSDLDFANEGMVSTRDALGKWRSQRDREALRRAGGEPIQLAELDWARLSEDLTWLADRYASWQERPFSGDLQDQLNKAIDRLLLRLQMGRTEVLDVPYEDLVWLAEVAVDVRWVLRWAEVVDRGDRLEAPRLLRWLYRSAVKGIGRPEWQPPVGQSPSVARFQEMADHARSRAERPASASPGASRAIKKTTSGSKPKRMTPTLANEKMRRALEKNPELALRMTLDGWAGLLRCAKGTVHKTEMWKLLNKQRKLTAIRRRLRR